MKDLVNIPRHPWSNKVVHTAKAVMIFIVEGLISDGMNARRIFGTLKCGISRNLPRGDSTTHTS